MSGTNRGKPTKSAGGRAAGSPLTEYELWAWAVIMGQWQGVEEATCKALHILLLYGVLYGTGTGTLLVLHQLVPP